jgi:hypothetical protein
MSAILTETNREMEEMRRQIAASTKSPNRSDDKEKSSHAAASGAAASGPLQHDKSPLLGITNQMEAIPGQTSFHNAASGAAASGPLQHDNSPLVPPVESPNVSNAGHTTTQSQNSNIDLGLQGQELHEQVADILKQGSVLLQGRVGVRAFPHLALARWPILPTSIGPTRNMYASRAPLPPAINYAHQAQYDRTVPTSLEIQHYSREDCRKAIRTIRRLS